jgi:hypothetical protein
MYYYTVTYPLAETVKIGKTENPKDRYATYKTHILNPTVRILIFHDCDR